MSIWNKIERRVVRGFHKKPLALRHERAIVSFTFDDVPQSACREGRRILEDHGARGTYYVAGGLEGRESPSGLIHTEEDLHALAEAGHEVGSHGYSHANYLTLTAAGVSEDLERNTAYLAALGLDSPRVNFAYPFGGVGFAAKNVCAGHFTSARGVKSGINIGSTDRLQLKSMPLYDIETDERTIDKLIEKTARTKGWLIFVSHGVLDNPDPYSCSGRLLSFALSRSLERQLEVLTIRDVIDNAVGAAGETRITS